MDDTTRRMSDPEDRTGEIRHEIEETREEMAETIDAIQEKLRPRTIVANATERVKTATTERLRAMADTAGEAAYDVTERTRDTAGGFLENIRENPYPATLVGLGIAWWVASVRRERDGSRHGAARWSDTGVRGRRSSAYGSGEFGYQERSMREHIEERGREYADEAREYARGSSEALRSTGRQAQDQVSRMLRENPLLVGAGALMLGAAFGMAVPETRQENEWLGDARDSVVERAQQMASETASRVQETASDVADAAEKVVDTVKKGQQG